MRNPKAFLSLGLLAAAGLLAATAMAADQPPQQSCSVSGYTITADAAVPTVGPCELSPNSTCTKIMYTISGGTSTPDHVAVFLREEATTGLRVLPPASTFSVTNPCTTGDSVIGLGDNMLCHERLIHWNNQPPKGSSFGLEVAGRRKPITTTVVVKKGRSSQGACPIVGIGFEDTSADGNCVHQCGDFSQYQSVRKVETFKFRNCEVTFTFDPVTGELSSFTQATGGTCQLFEGPVTDLFVSGGPLSGVDTDVTFGDGWISSGAQSCSTRLIAGRYCTVCN